MDAKTRGDYTQIIAYSEWKTEHPWICSMKNMSLDIFLDLFFPKLGF